MFRAPPLESNSNNNNSDRPAGSTFRDKVLGLFKQRQQSPLAPLSANNNNNDNNKESSKPFSFRLKRGSLPVRKRSRRGLSRFMHRVPSTRKELPKTEDVRVSLRLIEDIYHLDEEKNEDNMYDIDEEEDSMSVSTENTEPRDNRTSSRLILGLSRRSELTRGWSRTPDSCSKEMEIFRTSSSSPSRTTTTTTRTSPRSSMARSTGSVGQFGSSRQPSIMHLHDDSDAPMISRRNLTSSSRMQSGRSTINRTESPSNDKDSLKPPRTNCKPVVHSPPSDPSPKDVTQPIYPVAVGQGSDTTTTTRMGRPASRNRIVPELLKPRFREFPMKYPSQPMLSVPECEALPPRRSHAAAPAEEATPYLPGFSEGDYVDDERLERILKLIQLQKTEMESTDTRSSTSSSSEALPPMSQCAAMPPSNASSLATNPQALNYRPGFDAKDYVDDDQLDVVLKNLQDRDMRTKPSSFTERGVGRQYPSSYHSSQLKAVPPHVSKQAVMSPLRLTFCKHESIPIIRREIYRTYSLPSVTSIVRV